MKILRRRVVVCVLMLAVLSLSVIVVRHYLIDAAGSLAKTGDYEAAANRFKVLAYLGDRTSQYILGEFYAFGLGVERDDTQAIYWFKRAHVRIGGEADSIASTALSIGKRYAEGDVAEIDHAESQKWLRRAAEAGNEEAAALLDEPGK
ncbi:MAG: sel1 repeat family protein [Deltaproteobacteria bacterium]|nr:sel1 repeat family protein [Deltaproteobacteria bacterium]